MAEVRYLKMGGRLIDPNSDEGKELMKWEVKRPPTYFPKMLYMAKKRPDGIVSVNETDDRLFGGVSGAAEKWTATCQMVVKDEAELIKYREIGWRESQAEAMERFEAKEQKLGNEAAERAYRDRNMGEKAKAEIAAVEASTDEHVAEVPVAPIKRRPGRPRKNAVEA